MADCETGECYLDSETGELMLPVTTKPKPTRKRTFKIPKSEVFPRRRNRRKRIKATAKVIKDKDTSRIILFLLPTILGFPCLTVVCIILEIFIHTWTHHKNKRLKDKNICYRSPLYLYMQQYYCFKCREELYMSKIEHIQNERMQYEYLKRNLFSV